MVFHRSSFRIAAPSLLLALALISGSAAPAIARDAHPVTGAVHGGPSPASARTSDAVVRLDPDRRTRRPHEAARTLDATLTQPTEEVRPSTPDVPVASPVALAKSTHGSTSTRTADSTASSYHGRNHVWIPSLGINRSISFFACSSNAYPGNRVYRWGCAGSNNVYLFGHASSVFAPLHDAYVSGHLRKGMAVWYAGDDGVVHRYSVRWWKVTTPDDGVWAYASQGTPSLTLQTCVGARSQFRLIVRLVESG